MKRLTIVKVLAGVVVLGSVLVILGWIFDVGVLKSILPVWTTMRFSTALAFFVSGWVLYALIGFWEKKSQNYQVVLPVMTLIILLLMAAMFTSSFLGLQTGVESLFMKESAFAVRVSAAGRPSFVTMTNFVLIGLTGILTMLRPARLKRFWFWIGGMVGTVGALALAGYGLNLPFLYYDGKDFNEVMAFHTAFLFLCWGMALVLISRESKTRENN